MIRTTRPDFLPAVPIAAILTPAFDKSSDRLELLCLHGFEGSVTIK